METVSIPKQKLDEVMSDVERLVSHFEELIDEDQVAKKRITDIKEGRIAGKSERELDKYLEKRGVNVG
ncbi:MAG TPA: hypothetical protein VJB08_01050 [Candidatus Nanoarchaeia archaeon]|nr:hypothetical protein [Candidatus Nanoarchaeia archaeon]